MDCVAGVMGVCVVCVYFLAVLHDDIHNICALFILVLLNGSTMLWNSFCLQMYVFTNRIINIYCISITTCQNH